MKKQQLIALTLSFIMTSLINANPISIKNNTDYDLKVTVNGVIAKSMILAPQETKNAYTWSGALLDHNDFNRIQITNASNRYGHVTDIFTKRFKEIVNEDQENLQNGKNPCAVISADVGWITNSYHLSLYWGCLSQE